MRIQVPQFALMTLLSLLTCVASANRVDDVNVVTQYCQQAVGSLVDPAVREGICSEAQTAYCEASPRQLNNCTGGGQRRATPDIPNQLTPEVLEAKVRDVKRYCEGLQTQAQQCCGNDVSRCELSPTGQERRTAFQQLRPRSGGTNDVAAQTTNAAEVTAEYASSVGGSCFARASLCINECQDLARRLREVPCPTCAPQHRDQVGQLRAVIESCTASRGRTAAAVESVQALLRQREQSQRVEQATAGGGGPQGGRAGGTGDRTAPGGRGGGGMGAGGQAMMNGLMQGLMAAMRQGQQGQDMGMDPMSQMPIQCGQPGSEFYAHCAPQQAKAEESWNKSNPESNFKTESETSGNFNLGDRDGVNANGMDPQSVQPGGQPAMVNAIPNNGGGMLGAGGGPMAAGGPGGGGGGGGGAGGGTPRVEVSERSTSGYSQMAARMEMQSGGGGGHGGYGGGYDSGFERMSLAEFLPGGKQYAGRSTAGLGTDRIQIQAPEVNIWQRISERIRSRCTQGLLRDCIP